MNDRELLELAARAAGYEIKWEKVSCDRDHVAYYNVSFGDYWNSLYSPADALRLAVALHIELTYFAPDVSNHWTVVASSVGGVVYTTEKGPDELAATMRAITRVAAEIGRAKT